MDFPVYCLEAIAAIYCLGTLASFMEKLSAYRFAARYEQVSRSRETKREVKEIMSKVKKEMYRSFLWPLEVRDLYNKNGQ